MSSLRWNARICFPYRREEANAVLAADCLALLTAMPEWPEILRECAGIVLLVERLPWAADDGHPLARECELACLRVPHCI